MLREHLNMSYLRTKFEACQAKFSIYDLRSIVVHMNRNLFQVFRHTFTALYTVYDVTNE